MQLKMIEDDTLKLNKQNLTFQRWFYSLIGLVLLSILLLLNYHQIQILPKIKQHQDLPIYILFLVQSIYVGVCILSTAISCQITNAVLTTLSIVLLTVYTGIHFYIRFIFLHHRRTDDFYLMIIRLSLVSILFILILPWTNWIVHKYRMNISSNKEMIYSKSTTFSWLLHLDSMLIISLLILTMYNQSDKYLHQIFFLSIGMSLVLIWLSTGMHRSNSKTSSCFISIIFYTLSFLQIIYLIYITYQTIFKYKIFAIKSDLSLFPLLILTIICSSANILIHCLTIVLSFNSI